MTLILEKEELCKELSLLHRDLKVHIDLKRIYKLNKM
jgi:hypothetical protein